jgi:hypothetical protein
MACELLQAYKRSAAICSLPAEYSFEDHEDYIQSLAASWPATLRTIGLEAILVGSRIAQLDTLFRRISDLYPERFHDGIPSTYVLGTDS